MPLPRNVPIFRANLGWCRMHQRLDLGQRFGLRGGGRDLSSSRFAEPKSKISLHLEDKTRGNARRAEKIPIG
jgi:hypothetical protein